MGLAVVSAILMTSLNRQWHGTLSMIGSSQAQQAQGVWFMFKFFPLGLMAFCHLRCRVDRGNQSRALRSARSRIGTCGRLHTEYSGFRWSLYFLAEYANMIVVSSIAITLLLGGWLRPFPNCWRVHVGLDFLVRSRRCFLLLAAMRFYGTARMPKQPAVAGFRRSGLAVFGAAAWR